MGMAFGELWILVHAYGVLRAISLHFTLLVGWMTRLMAGRWLVEKYVRDGGCLFSLSFLPSQALAWWLL